MSLTVSSPAALRVVLLGSLVLVRQRFVSRVVGVGDCRRLCVPVHHSTVSGVATCCGYSRTHVRTLVHSLDGEGDGGRGEDDSKEVEDFCGPVPREKLTISYSRSSGPGGQNVNKLNTKAQVRFHLSTADWIPERIKERMHKLFGSKITKSGELVISSQRTRSQHFNTEDAINKLHKMLNETSEERHGPSELTLARIRLLKRRAERRRMVEKKYLALKKKSRQIDDL